MKPRDCFLQIGYRVGVGKAQIALTGRPKTATTEQSDAGLPEKVIGQGSRVAAEPPNVGEGVKGPTRQNAAPARNTVEAGHDDVAPDRKLSQHLVDRFTWSLEGRQPGHLGKGGCARIAIRHEQGNLRGQLS